MLNLVLIAVGITLALLADAWFLLSAIYFMDCDPDTQWPAECVVSLDNALRAIPNLLLDPLFLAVNFVLLLPLLYRILVWSLQRRLNWPWTMRI